MKHNLHAPNTGIAVDMDATKKQTDQTKLQARPQRESDSRAETKVDAAIGEIQRQANHVGPVLEKILTTHHNKV